MLNYFLKNPQNVQKKFAESLQIFERILFSDDFSRLTRAAHVCRFSSQEMDLRNRLNQQETSRTEKLNKLPEQQA